MHNNSIFNGYLNIKLVTVVRVELDIIFETSILVQMQHEGRVES